MTSLGENKENNPSQYFIVLASSVKTKEVEFHRIGTKFQWGKILKIISLCLLAREQNRLINL